MVKRGEEVPTYDQLFDLFWSGFYDNLREAFGDAAEGLGEMGMDLEDLLRRGEISVGIFIPRDFERRLRQPDRAAGQLLIDGSDTVVQAAAARLSGPARISPVMMPGLAIGMMVRQSVSQRVAPRARLPSRIERGMRARPSSVDTITTGRVSRASVSEAQNNPPVPKVGAGRAASKNRWSMPPPIV